MTGAFVTRLSDRERQALIGASRQRRYSRHAPVFHQGDPGEFVVVIEDGSVKVVATNSCASDIQSSTHH